MGRLPPLSKDREGGTRLPRLYIRGQEEDGSLYFRMYATLPYTLYVCVGVGSEKGTIGSRVCAKSKKGPGRDTRLPCLRKVQERDRIALRSNIHSLTLYFVEKNIFAVRTRDLKVTN